MTDSNEPQTTAAPGDASQDATVPGDQTRGSGAPGPAAHTGEGGHPQPVAPVTLHIRVDRQDIEVPPDRLDNGELTGRQIRELATPPISADRDLFEIVPGGSDRKIEDGEAVAIQDHLRFFSAPRNINPGTGKRLRSALRRSRRTRRRSVRRASQ